MTSLLPPACVATLVALATIVSSDSAFGADIVNSAITETDSAEQRINHSGKLRMLSQRIASAACHAINGVNEESSNEMLLSSAQEFEAILAALEFGDPAFDIHTPERRARSLQGIQELRDVAAPMLVAATAIQSGSASQDDVQYVLTRNGEVLASAAQLVSQLTDQYANPAAATNADLMLVDISGRQRMLLQKMSKESCLISAGNKADEIDNLKSTIAIFEASLEALRFGNPTVGMLPPPNKEISDGLEKVRANWMGVRPMLENVLAGQTLDAETEALKFNQLNETMVLMNTVVGMYADAAKPSR